ncbi:hypothetical protein B0H14DRAFT_2770772 [Mycena olivaceomarginata]|nr:hypothetical protein B0H14DRAFT_2770772 [Mycena olivaceomarginata]
MSAPIDPSTIHPDEFLYHCLSSSVGPETIRNRRKGRACCWVCLKSDTDLGRPLRRCGKCRLLSYCSKECQKKHWPEHKPMCCKDDSSKLNPRLVRTLFANPLLCLHLQSCFLLAFGLTQRWRRDELLLAHLDVAVEPSKLTDLADIFLRQRLPNGQIPGMLQLNRFAPATNVDSSDAHSRRLQEFWRSERDMADFEGDHDCAVGMLVVCHPETELSLTIPVRIVPSMMDMQMAPTWISEGLLIPSGVPGETITVPYTVENCLQGINTQIRADTTNQMLLRAVMQPSDIQLIRHSGMNFGPKVVALQAKMKREHIYKALWETFAERFEADVD